jgi:hypothetical protein
LESSRNIIFCRKIGLKKNTALLNATITILSKGITRRNFVSLLIKCTAGEEKKS